MIKRENLVLIKELFVEIVHRNWPNYMVEAIKMNK